MKRVSMTCAALLVAICGSVAYSAIANVAETRSEANQLQRGLPDLLKDAEWHAASLDCLSVTFTFDMDNANTPSGAERSRTEIDKCYEKVRRDQWFGKKEGTLTHRTVAFDGSVSTLQEHNRKRHSLYGEKLEELTLNGLGFFDFNMLVPPSASLWNDNDVSLVGVLGMSGIELRPETEAVNERPCFVVDRRSTIAGNITATIWIDAERAGVPMKQQYFVPGFAVPVAEFVATKVVEAEPGLWVIVEGTKTVRLNWEGNPKEFVTKLRVESDDKGSLLLKINPDLPESVFTPQSPPDFVISNHITGKVTLPKK